MEDGDRAAAAFFLGAMAHYIGDSSQFGHTYPDEANHSNYERWAATRIDSFNQVYLRAVHRSQLTRAQASLHSG